MTKILKVQPDPANLPVHSLAALLSKYGRSCDPQGFGYIAFEEDGPNRAPRFGESMNKAIESIIKFQRRHYGSDPAKFNHPVYILGEGIGGQATCAMPALGFTVKYKNRQLIPCDSCGINYRDYEQKLVQALRVNPKTKILWVVGSKSGSTDETMVNFQMGLKVMIRVWARFFYRDDPGKKIAEGLIAQLFDAKPLVEKTLTGLKLTQDELKLLREVFKNLVIVTGTWNAKKQSGSRLDRFVREGFLNDLYDKQKDKVVAIAMLDNLGGRFQGISPNAFVYNALLGLDIKAMLEAARECARVQRAEGLHESKKIAVDLWQRKIKHLLIAMPNNIIFARLTEALGQMIPESLGKGRRLQKEARLPNAFGIQTYAYDAEVINRAFSDFQRKGKAYLVLDVKAQEPIKLDKEIEKTNLIIRYRLKEINEVELAKLIQFVEDITVWVGMLNTADALLVTQASDKALGKIDLFTKKAVVEIMKGAGCNQEGDPFNSLREIFDQITPFRQPDVEFAKSLVKGKRAAGSRKTDYDDNNRQIAQGLYLDLDSLGLRDKNNEYKTGQKAKELFLEIAQTVEIPVHRNVQDHKKQIIELLRQLAVLEENITRSGVPLNSYEDIQKLKTQRNSLFAKVKQLALDTQLSSQQEKVAGQLMALLAKAHRDDKSLNFVLYEDRSTNTEILKRFAEFLAVDRFDFGPAEQHKSFQLTSGGIDVSVEVLIQSVRSLQKVKQTEELILFDGCVPEYLHGLYPSEVGAIYLRAYSKRFKADEVQTEVAVLISGDLTEQANIADFIVVLTAVLQ